MFRKNKQENKAKLEHKLYLARENPEPIFDLSDCDLNNVPPGIYSLCKVFLKEILNLENNNLTSLSSGGQLKDLYLLKILYIQNNAFKTLPDDIYLLKSLKELNISNNKLKLLPENMCKLENLEILNVSNNLLKSLPETLGNLTKLKQLNISGNSSIKYLPKSICKAQKLVLLDVDIENLLYPPKIVAENGLESIMRYICDDTGYAYVTSENVEETVEVDSRQNSYETDSFHAKIWELEKIKQQKVQDFLDIEKYNETLQKREFELANSQKADKEKLLTAIAEDQKRLNSKLNELQVEKETERFKLIEQLQEAEQNADIAINQLLSLSQKPMEQLLQQEKIEEERLLSAVNRYNETLRKDDILKAMHDILTQETEKFQQLHQYRQETSRTILEQELKSDTKLLTVLTNQEKYKNELVIKLQKDSELQKAIVGTLLERSDARSWSLMQQVRLVENQLASLTQIEIDRRKLQIDQHLSDFCQKRVDLSVLLMDLLAQQKQRRAQLLSTLQSIEDERNDNVEDFWLKQYQRLLDNMPEGLSQAQNNIDPVLGEKLLMNGVIHCLPFLAKLIQCFCNTSDITDNDLIEIGISDHNDRIHILDAFQQYEKERKCGYVGENRPSAPEMPLEEASAPLMDNIRSISSTECVICMDCDCAIIFVPCGHLCCCSKCSQDVQLCPLCRAEIQHKILLSY